MLIHPYPEACAWSLRWGCGRTDQVRGSLSWFYMHSSFLLSFSICRVEMMIIYSKYIIEEHARKWFIETVNLLLLLLLLLIIHISMVTLYTINKSSSWHLPYVDLPVCWPLCWWWQMLQCSQSLCSCVFSALKLNCSHVLKQWRMTFIWDGLFGFVP